MERTTGDDLNGRAIPLSQVYPVVLILACTLALAPLLSHVWMGSYMRYSGDDYCYASVLVRYGFWEAQTHSYLSEGIYNGNRFSLTFFSHLADLLGPAASGVLPGLVIGLWLAGLYGLARQLGRLARLPLTHLEAGLIALWITWFTLYLTPDVIQSLYWRSAMLAYTTPLVAATYTGLLAAFLTNRQKSPGWGIGLITSMAWVGAGFSEVGAVLHLALFGLVFIFTLPAWKKGIPAARTALPLLNGVLAGTVAAIVMLFVSPSNVERLARLPARLDAASLIQMSAYHARVFVYEFRTGDPLSALVFVLLALAFGFQYFWRLRDGREFGRLSLFLSLVVLFSSAAVLLVALMVPHAYIQASYPENRALIGGTWVTVVTILAAGFFAGKLLAMLLPSRLASTWLVPAAWLGVGVLSLYSLRATPRILRPKDMFQRWAMMWDQRDRQIRLAGQAGANIVEVVRLDHPVPDVGELSEDDGYWYNNCAEWYYDIDAIRANQPGWDD